MLSVAVAPKSGTTRTKFVGKPEISSAKAMCIDRFLKNHRYSVLLFVFRAYNMSELLAVKGF